MAFQRCPICNGEGKVFSNNLGTSLYTTCTVCNGQKIINESTGLPPSTQEERKQILDNDIKEFIKYTQGKSKIIISE